MTYVTKCCFIIIALWQCLKTIKNVSFSKHCERSVLSFKINLVYLNFCAKTNYVTADIIFYHFGRENSYETLGHDFQTL